MTEASMIRLATAADRLGVERYVHLAYNPYIDDVGKVPAPMLDDYGDLIERGVVRVAEAAGEVVGAIVMSAAGRLDSIQKKSQCQSRSTAVGGVYQLR